MNLDKVFIHVKISIDGKQTEALHVHDERWQASCIYAI